eukprot:COSAG02_NODE_665_length_18739_cov_9.192918_2_plen_1287_part_00
MDRIELSPLPAEPMVIKAEPVDPHGLSREIVEEMIHSAVDKGLRKMAAGSASFGNAGVVRTFDDEYVPPLELPQKGTLLIDSDCGLGKSTQIVKACQELRAANPHARIIAVSSRKSHAQDLTQDLETGGLDPWCYLDRDKYFQYRKNLRDQREGMYEDLSMVSYVDHPCVVISLEHMTDLRLCGRCDLLILDEIRSLADKTKEQTTVQSMGCFDELQRHYREARFVISADADCRVDNAVKYLHNMDSARQVTTWHIPFKRMKRAVRISYQGGSQQIVPKQFLEAIRTLIETGKIGVATSTRSMANKYADVCRREGIRYKLYHGKSDARAKRYDFSDPDAAWKDVDVIIFNSCLTVGVDPKTTVFAKCFMHSSRYGASVRDLFQGICRLGRKEHLLLDKEIFAVVNSKDPQKVNLELKANPAKMQEYIRSAPTFDSVLKRVVNTRRSNHENAKDEMEFVGMQHSFKVSDDWFVHTRAACELESELDQRRHAEQFHKYCKHRGWSILVDDEETGGAVEVEREIQQVLDSRELQKRHEQTQFINYYSEGTHYTEEPRLTDYYCRLLVGKTQREELMNLPQFYEVLQKSAVDPDKLFTDCFGILEQHETGGELTTTEDHLKDVYWALYNIRTLDLSVEDFTTLVNQKDNLQRFVAAHFMPESSVRNRSAEALSNDAHPEMRNSKVSLSKAFRAAKILSQALGVESWTTLSSYELSKDIVAILNDEYRRAKISAVDKLHNEKYEHSKKAHELNGMTFREIAEKNPSLDQIGLCEWTLKRKPNSKLAGYLRMVNGGTKAVTASHQETQLADALTRVAALLGIKPKGIWQTLQSAARCFGMKIQKANCEESEGNGRRMRGLFKTVTVQFEHGHIIDHWLLADNSQFIPASQWFAHLAIADYDATESLILAEYERPSDKDKVVGERVERVVKSALVSFEQEVKQKYEDASEKYIDIKWFGDEDKRTKQAKKHLEDAKNEWDYLKRMLDRGRDDPDSNDVLLLGTDYIVKYCIGRQIGTWPSLQSCCRKFRGALAKVFYHDIDVANCHFVLMLQVAEDHRVDLPTVAHYADSAHRENVLKEVMEFYECGRESAKQLLLSILNGGGPQAWMVNAGVRSTLRDDINGGKLEHLEVVRSLQGEYQKIRDVMFTKYASQVEELINQIKTNHTYKEIERDGVKKLVPMTDEDYKRKAFSTCLQNEENIVLKTMDHYFQEEGYSVDVLVYDGMMVRRRHGTNPVPLDMLRNCEDYVYHKTGYPIRLEEKCLGCGSKLAACKCADKTVPQIEEMEPEPEPEE